MLYLNHDVHVFSPVSPFQITAYKCSGCNKKVKARKRLTIYRTPPVLTIQLKRFQFVQMFGGAKINKPVLFTEKLDLAPFLAKPEVGFCFSVQV
jgi:ubiquitin C-terminal hydrolase